MLIQNECGVCMDYLRPGLQASLQKLSARGGEKKIQTRDGNCLALLQELACLVTVLVAVSGSLFLFFFPSQANL